MLRLSLRWARRESGSISAPARNVSRPAPKVARKLIQSLVLIPRALPATTPSRISIRATDTPRRIEMRLAINAIPIQADATNQTLCMPLTSGYTTRVLDCSVRDPGGNRPRDRVIYVQVGIETKKPLPVPRTSVGVISPESQSGCGGEPHHPILYKFWQRRMRLVKRPEPYCEGAVESGCPQLFHWSRRHNRPTPFASRQAQPSRARIISVRPTIPTRRPP